MGNTNAPDTTVVVPVYNVEKYLRECIDSVIRQTYPNIRIILVDDGSTDSSGQICDEYARIDSRITVIHKTNGGLSDARNAGLAQANTKYIYFLDSDDYIDPETIEILHGISERNNLDALYFDALTFSEEGFENKTRSRGIRNGSYPGVMAGSELFLEFFRNIDYFSQVQLQFYRRDFLVKNGISFMKGIIHEDELFTPIAMMSAERVMHIPLALYHMRTRAGSIMTTRISQRNSDGMYIALHEMLHRYSRFRDDPHTKSAYDKSIEHLTLWYFMRYIFTRKVQNEKGRSQMREIKRELKERGYDISWVKLKLQTLRIIIRKRPALKNFLKERIKSAKKFIRRFIPKFDDEQREILQRLRDTNRLGVKRIITLCVPRHANRGDIAIALAQRKILASNFPEYVLIEIPEDLCANYPGIITKNLNTRDIILTNGGGWFGSLWRHNTIAILKILRKFPDNRIIIMPQTVYYSDDERGRKELAYDRKAFAKFTDFHVFVRDRKSYDLIHRENLYPNAKSVNHVPDMVCSMDFRNLAPEKRSGVLVCLRPDIEKVIDSEVCNQICARLIRKFSSLRFWTTNPAQNPSKIHDWEEALEGTLKVAAGAELIVADRLHAMLFAAITGTPCVAFDNRTGKVHSVYEWISDCGYIQLCRGLDDFDGAVKKALSVPHEWDNSGLMGHFKKITDLISEKESH